MNPWLSIVVPCAVALLALAGTIYNVRSQAARNRAETNDAIATASTATIDALKDEIARLNMRVATQGVQIQDLRLSAKRSLELTARLLHGIMELRKQLENAGLIAVWLPNSEIDRLIAVCLEDSEALNDQGRASTP